MRARYRRPHKGWVTARMSLAPGLNAGNHRRVKIELIELSGYCSGTIELDKAAAFQLSNSLIDYFETGELD